MTFHTKLQRLQNHCVSGSINLISEKSGIADSINPNFAKIGIVSYNSLPFEERLTFHNVIIIIKSVVNKNKNEYYYKAINYL